MSRKLNKTLLDYLVIAISPALIITMVGSLVFFLVEVFYQGNFQGRVNYILALFVMAAVLIARISIEEGRERAILFAIPLGIAVLLVFPRFVQFQGSLQEISFLINCGLIALVWWSADKLTWDCTLIDENEEDSGEGLLESVGLDKPNKAALQQEITPATGGATTNLRSVPGLSGSGTRVTEERPTSWWKRFVERRRRPHAPGVWIVYFSLAALPLFGIGQIFIPADKLPEQQYAFNLLAIYTASGLGLLLATSFLGLRRYLRQRRQEMPFLMVNVWLVIGGVLIAGVMAAAMLLPRPNAEYAVSELPFRIGSPDQKASPYGMGSDGVKENQSNARQEPGDSDKAGAVKSDKQVGSQSAQRKEQSQIEHNSDKKATGTSRTAEKEPPKSANKQKQDESQRPDNVQQKPDIQRPASLPNVSSLVNLFKWALCGALVLIAIIWFCRHFRNLLSALLNFRQWLWDFWNNLFGGKSSRADADAQEADPKHSPQRRFADFTDPFASGMAGRYAPEELVRYTFEALEAWARDHGYERQPEQTPHEFTRSLAASISSMADTLGRLADLYCQVAYAPGMPPTASMDCLPRLWRDLHNEPAGTSIKSVDMGAI